MINLIIALSLGLLVLTSVLELAWQSSVQIEKLDQEIIGWTQLEKAQRWVMYFAYSSELLDLDQKNYQKNLTWLNEPSKIQALGLDQPGRGEYEGSGGVLILKQKKLIGWNTQKNDFNWESSLIFIYHCAAGLCFKKNDLARQVLVSGISEFYGSNQAVFFKINKQAPLKLKLKLRWVIGPNDFN